MATIEAKKIGTNSQKQKQDKPSATAEATIPTMKSL